MGHSKRWPFMESLYERRESFQVIVTVKKGTRDCLSLASSQNNKTPTCTRPQVAGKVFKFREERACESPSYDQNTHLTASQTGGGLFLMATSKRRIKTEKARSKCPSYLQFCLQKCSLWGAWVAQSVGRPTLGFRSGRDLSPEIETHIRSLLSGESA